MVLRALDRLEEYLTATLLAAMTLLTFSQVVLRYVFDTGLIWALEATTYLFGWLVLVGISFGVRTRSHIAVDIVSQRLAAGPRKAVALIAVASSLLYAGLMCYGSLRLIGQLRVFASVAHDIPLPRWVLLSSLPIGFALLGLRLVQAAIEVLRGTRDGLGPSGEGSAELPGERRDP